MGKKESFILTEPFDLEGTIIYTISCLLKKT